MKAWITRDKDDRVYFYYKNKPSKCIDSELWQNGGLFSLIPDEDIPDGINPKWEDDEPIEVELKLEKI